MLSNPNIDIWGHPTLFAKKNKFTLSYKDILATINLCLKYNVLIEKNMKYNVPDGLFQGIASNMGCKFVNGSDAHQISELLKIGRGK